LPPKIITKTVYKPCYIYVQDTTGQSPSLEEAKRIAESNFNNMAIAESNKSANNLNKENAIYFIGASNLNAKSEGIGLRNIQPEHSFVSPIDNNFEYAYTPRKPLGLQIEWNASTAWMMPDASINPSSFAKFNNNSVSVFYELDNNWIIGAGLRQETFFQDFEGTDSRGERFRYEQQPNLTTYSLALRYRTNPFWGFCSLLSQGTVGLNNAGPVVRGSVGTEISLSNAFSFVVGLEYSNLFYKHQNSNYNSSKMGLVYGLNFKF
jgi:long-subunit fatty acid transport protein